MLSRFRFRAVALLALALTALGCADTIAPARTRAASAPNAPPPVVPCVDTIFDSNFNSDVQLLPPGVPRVGSWKMNTAAGSIVVVKPSGAMSSQYVELAQTAGIPGGVGLRGQICLQPPNSGTAEIEWRSMVRSATVKRAAVVVRDATGRILGRLGYSANGLLTYNNVVLPVTWTQGVAQDWRILIDLTAQTTTLSLNWVPQVVAAPYFDAWAANFWEISMELEAASAQRFAWDDILIVYKP
jgi:hypothetical protein